MAVRGWAAVAIGFARVVEGPPPGRRQGQGRLPSPEGWLARRAAHDCQVPDRGGVVLQPWLRRRNEQHRSRGVPASTMTAIPFSPWGGLAKRNPPTPTQQKWRVTPSANPPYEALAGSANPILGIISFACPHPFR